MSDKLQKTNRSIDITNGLVDKLEAPTSTSLVAPLVQQPPRIKETSPCICGHTYDAHNYSTSALSADDPLGFMYECKGAGFSYGRMTDDDPKPRCDCRKFRLDLLAIANSFRKYTTNETTCINTFNTTGPHQCPGFVLNADNEQIFCRCSCSNCLSAERKAMGGGADSVFVGNGLSRQTVYTSPDICVGGNHADCIVVSNIAEVPVVCKCECRECKRAWFSDGRPIVRGAKIIRTPL